MKILIQTINFYPELTGIGKYTGEMASWLSNRGHRIRVITTPPYYPDWKVHPTYKSFSYSRESWRGCMVWRCPLWVPDRPSGVSRIFHLLSFLLGSFPIMLGQIFWRPDIVLTIEPPFFNAPIALLVARLSGAKSILHIQDLEIDAAFGLGLLKGGTIKRFSFFCERKLLSYFDLISTISKSMLSKIVEKGIPREAIYYFPNWADTSHFSKKSQREFRDYLQIPDDYIVALYSGNMGAKQGLELLSAVVKLYSSRPKDEVNIIFIFCGNGPSRLALEKSCSEFDFVRFIDLQPADRFADFLKMADIHLLPQRSNVEDLVMPSKLTGMLASGRPVIATAVEGSELAEVVSGCGLAVPPNDPELFYEALVILAKDAPLRKRLGEAGEAYALNFLSMDSILYDFELKLKNRLRSH